MCVAFVYGIAATSVSATSPCAHHSPMRSDVEVVADAGERAAHEPARRAVVEVGRAVHRDPHALEHEARDEQVQQPADERPVAPAVRELRRPRDRAPDHHVQHAREQHDPHHVEDQRVPAVEVALEEAPAEEALGDIGVDRSTTVPMNSVTKP